MRQKNQRFSVFDGMKGVAILIIIMYYYFQYLLPGGFMTVNVFFVLSGFFAFKSNRRTFASGEVWHWFSSKIARLWFSMCFMIVLVVTYIVLFDRAYLFNLTGLALSSLVFVNHQFQLVSEQSYFVQSVNPSPFIHLWYVSLFLQYQLIVPIFKYVSNQLRWNQRTESRILGIISVISVIAMGIIYWIDKDPSRVYYAFSTRLFAFSLGGATACYIGGLNQLEVESANELYRTNILSVLSIVGMIVLMKVFDGTHYFVYPVGLLLYTLLVCGLIYTVLFDSTLIGWFFKFKVFQFFGKRSYAYYLWYYPIHLMLPQKFASLNHLVLSFSIQFMILMIMSEITYRLIEQQQLDLGVGQTFNVRRLVYNIQKLYKNGWKANFRTLYTIFYVVCLVTATIGLMIAPESRNEAVQVVQQKIEQNKALLQKEADSVGGLTSPNTQSNDVNTEQGNANLQDATSTLQIQTPSVSFIGDSILLAIADQLQAVYPNAVIDGETGRQLYNSESVITRLKDANQLAHHVVIFLGTNGNFSSDQIDRLIHAIGTERQIYFATVVMNKDWQNTVNSQIHDAATRHTNVHVIDWYSAIRNHQSEWLYEDGIHPNATGAQQIVSLIQQHIATE